MARNGKIARLPLGIRNALNERLQNGEMGKPLLDWLNHLPIVIEVLEEEFEGLPINKQSLSAWRRGGYQEWLRHQESRKLVREMTEQAGELETEANERSVADALAALMAVELARTIRGLLQEEPDLKQRWKRLQEAMPQLAQLRRADHRAARLRMEEENWMRERERQERADEESELAKAKKKAIASITAPLRRPTLVEAFGGGEKGEKLTDCILEIQSVEIPRRRDEFDGVGEDPPSRGRSRLRADPPAFARTLRRGKTARQDGAAGEDPPSRGRFGAAGEGENEVGSGSVRVSQGEKKKTEDPPTRKRSRLRADPPAFARTLRRGKTARQDGVASGKTGGGERVRNENGKTGKRENVKGAVEEVATAQPSEPVGQTKGARKEHQESEETALAMLVKS
jgi:hypothetical protein